MVAALFGECDKCPAPRRPPREWGDATLPINEWWEEHEKALRVLRMDLAQLSTDELRSRIETGVYRDRQLRRIAEEELSRRRAGATSR